MAAMQSAKAQLSEKGVFQSVPSVFDRADEGLKHVFKLEFPDGAGDGVDGAISTDRVLLDIGGVDPHSIDLKRAMRDCDIIKAALEQHGDVLRQAFKDLTDPAAHPDKVRSISAVLAKVGLTEDQAISQGGGFVALVAVAAVVLLAGCVGNRTIYRPPHTAGADPADAGTD